MKTYTYANKIGHISIFEEDDFIVEIRFGQVYPTAETPSPLILQTITQIDEYLTGKRTEFQIPYRLLGSPFETDVLKAMLSIPYGETISYKELAIKSNHENAIRAVGSVCRKNKIPIIIPCHRVIKSDGTIGNYSGGIDTKKLLLQLEK